MASVAAIYGFRLLTSLTALKLYALTASALGIALFVSVGNVAQNFVHAVANGDLARTGTFIFGAVSGTTLLVQIALLLGTLALGSLFLDVVRTFSSRRALFA
jgi:hypothetical protein